MVEKEQSTIELLREISQQQCNCYEVMKMFGLKDCGDIECIECIPRLMGVIAQRVEKEQALPDGVEQPRFDYGELVGADGVPISVGDIVYCDDDPEPLEVDSFDDSRRISLKFTKNPYNMLYSIDPSRLTHERPTPEVLDADGMPIEIGDTVWTIYNGRKHVISGVSTWGSKKYGVRTVDSVVEYEGIGWDFAKKVTHAFPDSWKQLEKDVHLSCSDYCEKYDVKECNYNMRMHIFLRAKELASIEAGGVAMGTNMCGDEIKGNSAKVAAVYTEYKKRYGYITDNDAMDACDDSFEKIIFDSQLTPCEYSRKRGFVLEDSMKCSGCMFSSVSLFPCDRRMRHDLVRRCKEVASGGHRSEMCETTACDV